MKCSNNFKFLNLQEIKRKNADELKEGEKTFIKLNLLDEGNNPCAFMVFDKEIKEGLLNNPITSLADICVNFDLTYNNNIWNVRVLDLIML